jgi:hypothetical protein
MEACRDERVRVILQKLYKFELCLSTSIYGGLCKIDEEEGGVLSADLVCGVWTKLSLPLVNLNERGGFISVV